jgi:hypothetical protein
MGIVCTYGDCLARCASIPDLERRRACQRACLREFWSCVFEAVERDLLRLAAAETIGSADLRKRVVREVNRHLERAHTLKVLGQETAGSPKTARGFRR